MEHKELTGRIIGCAIKVHQGLGPGFLESVYQKAFVHELRKEGLSCECGKRIQVWYDGIVVGEFVADLFVENLILVEIKANQCLVPENEVQLVNYLTATHVDVGLLINFGAPSLQFKRKHRVYQPRTPSVESLPEAEQNSQD